MDLFNAVRTLSTQARYTQGLFTSDVDDYIDVNAYDPAIGTFFFLGASPVGNNVITTNPINGLSFGFARSFSNFYLGLYFGGQLVGARGQSDSGNGTLQAGSDKKASWATSNWDISLAILYGSEALGGIRLDLTLIGTDTISTFDGKTIGNGNTNASYGNRYTTGGLGAIIAGSWGKDLNDTLAAHATLGFRFPDYVLYSNPSAPSGTLSKRTTYSNAMWIINSGIAYDLNEVSTLEADLSLGGDFGSVTTPDVGSKTTEPGSFGLVVDAALVNIFTPVAGLELGLKPYAGLGFVADPGEVLADAGRFEFALGVDAGLKAQLPGKLNKLSVVTGAGLNIFDWRTISNSDTPSPSKEGSAFWIGGIGWKDETLGPSGQLGIGLVLDPSPNLSIGFGINALLDGLFIVDLTTMRVTPGSFFAGGTPGGFLTGLFDSSVSIDLTVSYKF
ncbi:MAG: hypothetical protein LBU00_06875 [Treponema sp.]|nr:hypothetical protein [Treponema sp.]